MAEGQWYYTENGQPAGPVSFYQLQQKADAGNLLRTDFVWTEGQAEWKAAGEIAGLFSPGGPSAHRPPAVPTAPAGGGGELVMPASPPRDPTVMAILSLVLPGLGQVVLGQTVKGVVLFLLFLGVWFSTACFGGVAVAIAAIIDAYQIATRLKRGQPVGHWEFF